LLLLGVCLSVFPFTSGYGAEEAAAEITISVPADAEIFFDGRPTTQQGAERRFQTPPLPAGQTYSYAVRALWRNGGKAVERTRNIEVTAGSRVRIDFLASGQAERRSFAGPDSPDADRGGTGEDSQAGKALKARANEFIAAFNRGDAQAVASFWTPDGDFVDQAGTRLKGREAIQSALEKQFAALKGAKLRIMPSSLRFVTPDLAIEDGMTQVVPADGAPPLAVRYTSVHVKRDGQWFLSSVRDSVAVPPSHAGQLDGLGWLIGEWEGEAREGETVRVSFAWDDGENFIVSHLVTTQKDVPVSGSTQWIGWDAAAKRIRSWTFLSGGGFTEGAWTQEGNQWKADVSATLHDGKKASATNLLTRVDADHFTWQPTNLSVAGKSIPDGEPVKMKRGKPAP
jgi:uncharacterized protein (TIGR02246 family)